MVFFRSSDPVFCHRSNPVNLQPDPHPWTEHTWPNLKQLSQLGYRFRGRVSYFAVCRASEVKRLASGSQKKYHRTIYILFCLLSVEGKIPNQEQSCCLGLGSRAFWSDTDPGLAKFGSGSGCAMNSLARPWVFLDPDPGYIGRIDSVFCKDWIQIRYENPCPDLDLV